MIFPNNKHQALQRALSLKRKVEKNPKMFADYKDFMNMIISKGYAVKIDEATSNKGQVLDMSRHSYPTQEQRSWEQHLVSLS